VDDEEPGFGRGPCDTCGSPYDGDFHKVVRLGRRARGRRPLGERRAAGVSEHTRRRQEWADAHPGEERGWANGGYSGTVDDALRAMSDDERGGVYSRHPWLEAPRREAARSVTLIGGGNTHRPEGWEWDRHLSAFTAHQARLFSCSCGDELDMPGYRHCRCGKVWNGYAVASGGDTRTAHADTYLVREVPVRKDVILAGRRGAAVRAANRRLAGEGDPQWYNDQVDSLGKKPSSRQKLDKARRDLKHWVGTNGGSYGKAQADKLKRLVKMYENDVARGERQAGRVKDQWMKDREDAGEDPQWPWPSEVGQDSPKVSQSPVDWHRRDSGGKWTPPGVPAKKGKRSMGAKGGGAESLDDWDDWVDRMFALDADGMIAERERLLGDDSDPDQPNKLNNLDQWIQEFGPEEWAKVDPDYDPNYDPNEGQA
jgi:hypothetical protein